MRRALWKFVVGEPPSEEIRERVRREQAERRGKGGSMGVGARILCSIAIGWGVFAVVKIAVMIAVGGGGGLIADMSFIPGAIFGWFALEGQAKRKAP